MQRGRLRKIFCPTLKSAAAYGTTYKGPRKIERTTFPMPYLWKGIRFGIVVRSASGKKAQRVTSIWWKNCSSQTEALPMLYLQQKLYHRVSITNSQYKGKRKNLLLLWNVTTDFYCSMEKMMGPVRNYRQQARHRHLQITHRLVLVVQHARKLSFPPKVSPSISKWHMQAFFHIQFNTRLCLVSNLTLIM